MVKNFTEPHTYIIYKLVSVMKITFNFTWWATGHIKLGIIYSVHVTTFKEKRKDRIKPKIFNTTHKHTHKKECQQEKPTNT